MAYLRCTGTPGGSLKLRTAQGEIASFETNIIDTLKEVKCSINPVQNGTPWIDSNEVNKEPYIKRAVAGTATRIGNHLYDKLVGGTVAFNQLVKELNSTNWTNETGVTVSFSDGTATFSSTTARNGIKLTNNISLVKDHKYFLYCLIKNADSVSHIVDYGSSGFTGGYLSKTIANDNNYYEISGIKNASSTNNDVPWYVFAEEIYSNISVKECMLIDLTAMFESTIADYIYSLEQATAGAGVAWFKALFPNDYYAYNEGELMSVKATAHVMKNASNTVIGNYALDSNLELRGIPKLVNNKLEYDGDTYESSGAVGRKYGIIDLGTIQWVYSNTSGHERFYGSISDIKTVPQNVAANIICPKYLTDTVSNIYVHNADKTIGSHYEQAQIWIYDSDYDDVTAFKNSLSGVYLVYEKATPTTEQASPFTNPQVCDENGTEEYTDSRAVAIPVGHETYQANICPISGFTEANITRCGVNLWDEEWRNGYYDASGVFHATPTGYTNLANTNPIIVKPNTNYYFKAPQNNSNTVCWYDGNMDLISANTNVTFNTVIQSPANAKYLNVKFNYSGVTEPIYNNDCSINYPSTDTTYHPYTGNTYTISFGQTVYGGVLDVTRGKLHVKWSNAVDLGLLGWAYDVAQQVFVTTDFVGYKNGTPFLCDVYTDLGAVAISQITNCGGTLRGVAFYIKNTDYTDAPTFKTAMSGKYITAELATPFDIDLTPEQIETLLGINNVWHDCNGDTEVKYLYLE